jgi:hypothetical protein
MSQSVRLAKSLSLLLALAVCSTLPVTYVLAADPCCTIVSIDKATGTVTLRDNKTGKLEKASVRDADRLAKLVVGQPTDHLVQRYCSVSTFEPCLDQERTHNCQPCPSEH